MISIEDKLLVNDLVTQSIKLLPKIGMLGMNEKSLEYADGCITIFENLANKMQRTKNESYDDDIKLLTDIITKYKEHIAIHKKNVGELNKEVSGYNALFLSLKNEIEQKIESNK